MRFQPDRPDPIVGTHRLGSIVFSPVPEHLSAWTTILHLALTCPNLPTSRQPNEGV